MDSPLAWTRPTWKPRRLRIVSIAAVASCGVAFALGTMAGGTRSSTTMIPIVAPVNVTLPALPPLPAPTVVVQPPAPAPEPPPLPPPPAPRAATPHLEPQCLLASPEGGEPPQAEDPTCAWDDGFPAISADGALIATKSIPDDGGRGYPGEWIHFLDAKTGHLVRNELVLSPSEYDPAPAPLAKLRVKVHARAAAIQRMLDARKFHALIALGGMNASQTVDPAEDHTDRTKIHAEFAGSMVRVIDPATATELGRQDLGAPSPSRHDDDEMCGGWELRWLGVWWDPATRVVLGLSGYRTGGCMCSDALGEQVAHLP